MVSAIVELDRDLRFMETLRGMKARFFGAVIAASASNEPGVLLPLRQESLYQLAEFLFAVESYGIDSTERIERLASLHNEHLLALRQDKERMRHLGLRADRMEEALFTGDIVAKLIANFSAQPPAIDQSDLARFLVTVMSSETCRKLAVACAKAGFLTRVRSPYGAVLVRSTGKLEKIFGKSLREARHAVAAS